MTWRSGSSDGTFYFQAWHVAKVVSGESWVQNKGLADFVEQNIGPETKNWLYIKGCVPTKEKPGLLVPYSICAKVRTPKSGQNPKDPEQALLHFRNEEFPSIAKTYFATKLNKTLDFFNSYAEGAEFETPLGNFDTVKSSKKLRERVKSAVKFVKKDFWGDIVHGLVDGVSKKDGHFSPKSEFKATRFLKRRGKDPASNPNILPPTPLQNPLPLPDNGFARVQEPELSPRPRKTSDLSDVTVASTDAPSTNASTVDSVETAQSSVIAEESSSSELQDAKESSSESQEAKESSSVVAEESSSSELQDAKETSSESQDTKESSSELLDAEESSPEPQDTNESSSELQDTTESSELQDTNESSSELQDAKESDSESSPAVEEEEASTSPADKDASSTTAGDSTTNAEVDASSDVTATDSSEASYQETTTEPTTDATNAPVAITAPSSSVIATRRKMNSVSSQGAQTAYFVVQNSGNWLRYLMASQGQSTQKLRSTFFDSPIILAAPVQAQSQDGMMRVYFMSQAKKQEDEMVCDEKGRAIRKRRGSKSAREWVVGTAKIPTHALTMHLGKQIENRNTRLLPAAPPAVRKVDSVVGPNNRLIEMTDAPGIPQAILVTTPPVEDVREGDIVQEERDDGFVHIETNVINRRVEEVVEEAVEEVVSDNVDDTDKKAKAERKASKADKKLRSKGKLPSNRNKSKTKKTTKVDKMTDTSTSARADVKTDIGVDANSVPPRKPSKVYTPPFSRKSWRDVEPQEPQVIYDTMSGYNFLQVEDVQIFSFSTSSHDMMLRTTPVPAAVEDGEGIDVWSPPVVGIFSWMWDYLAPGGWPKSAAVVH